MPHIAECQKALRFQRASAVAGVAVSSTHLATTAQLAWSAEFGSSTAVFFTGCWRRRADVMARDLQNYVASEIVDVRGIGKHVHGEKTENMCHPFDLLLVDWVR